MDRKLFSLKLTIIGAALTISGPAVEFGEMFLAGLVMMVVGLLVGNRINEEKEK